MFFASDNSGPVHPSALAALERANTGHVMGYGNDALTAQVADRIRDLFEAPGAAVFLVTTGTAANALALSTLVQPYDAVFCTPHAHIHLDEGNAPEFFTSGAKLSVVRGDDRMTPAALADRIAFLQGLGLGGAVPQAVSLTQMTEMGNLYELNDLREICAMAAKHGLSVHLDGARFANACVALGCTPAEMTWKAGVDVAVFGGTKNGLMGAEAVIFFDPDHGRDFELRRKRGAHLLSKYRYLAAQMSAYLADDLWITLARQANANCAQLVQGLDAVSGFQRANDARGNVAFFTVARGLHHRLKESGAAYVLWQGSDDGHEDDPVMLRFVCDWSLDPDLITEFTQMAGDL
ncbi:MAG: beta-eliminating lyase-related protein [Rhodobacteraceae bacterium]|nr:beta-eliminating lyase-related protein [Paracoccaceae bacterium]